ncbi:LEAF RUST 10 DISEASE-RESISTANCE LOCUS RECEPTOR-LIKE PROTEIN KINASE-like 2.8 [Lathyrus oleraceus]|uniref:LEAF RUST 10 DISEASE-RESISTANCE LOCUS RECEPTOR-LIKE PROTEIN KINASE-like 2.8 n=1 Tax=Pisum sativum TaxID=3888 RepID=UPI001FC4C552|nr:LEAF RUST 10 DISEASE-RESISTANCE LOCUS RECEPTOR-LIKE PROTEIN KINASE-like 2.8 [Pisum sativum]
MNKKSTLCISSSLIYSYCITIFYFLTTTTLCYAVDPYFEACEPKTCGNQTITYPFYINGIQEPFCGYPGFGLTCDNTIGFPILNLSNTFYTINQIFYQNHSFRVSNIMFSRPDTKKGCLSFPPTQDLSFPNNMFYLAHDQTEVRLFFGCDSSKLPRSLQRNKIGCSAGNETSSVVALYADDKNVSFVSKNCRDEVVYARVENGVKGEIQEALRKGFRLNWIASDCKECNSTGGRCGFAADIFNFRCYCTDRIHAAKCVPVTVRDAGRSPPVVNMVTIVGSVTGVACALLIVLVCWFRKKIFPPTFLFFRKENPTYQTIEKFLKEHGPLPVARYNYSDIKKITNSFKMKLGQGGYGSVYKGKLRDGRIVAVKILSELEGNGQDFINEVASISTTSHINVVRLLGFCLDGSKKALIYEFMSNGSLEKFIYEDKNNQQVDLQLDCKILYDIAVGIACGLEYLHIGCNTRILHFDIKPHNILLDDDFCPKISDFGLAKICPTKESIVSIFGARGTPGYIAPELFSRNFGEVSHKSDVYSYGMMVLEMVGRRKNIKVEVDCSSELYFPHLIYQRLELNQDLGLNCIKNEIDEEMVRKMTMVSLWCIQTNPSNRPAMHKVVEMLEGSLQVLEIPPKPFMSSPSVSSIHLSSEIL